MAIETEAMNDGLNRRTLLRAAPALLLAPGLARAETFPGKPMRYIVPVAAGGGSDMVGRTVTERWAKVLGGNFIVENQGGGGIIASQNCARAAANGYTLMQGYVATHGTSPATRHVPYDPVKDFTPIGMIGRRPCSRAWRPPCRTSSPAASAPWPSPGLKRHPQFKDLPTLDEAGFEGFDAQQWYGAVGPAGMPAPVVKRLNETLATVLKAPDLREKLSVEAIEPMPMSAEQFGAFMKADIARWTRLAKARGISLDS